MPYLDSEDRRKPGTNLGSDALGSRMDADAVHLCHKRAFLITVVVDGVVVVTSLKLVSGALCENRSRP